MIALVAAALAGPAADSAGFGAPGALPTDAATLTAAGLFVGVRQYGEGQLLLQGHVKNLGFDLEYSGFAGAGTGWSDAGSGTLRIGVRAFFGSETVHSALGVDARVTVAEAPTVSFWVLRGADARSGLAPRLTWDLSVGPKGEVLSLRFALGLYPMIGSAITVTRLSPIGTKWAVLTEAEVVADPTPVSLRVGARWRPSPHWSADAVIQVPVELTLTHPVFVPALQVRGEL